LDKLLGELGTLLRVLELDHLAFRNDNISIPVVLAKAVIEMLSLIFTWMSVIRWVPKFDIETSMM